MSLILSTMATALLVVVGATCSAQDRAAKESTKSTDTGRAGVRRAMDVQASASDFVKLIRESKNALVRKHAARALSRMGPRARDVLPDLKKALAAETDKDVKEALELAIKSIDPPLERLPAEELMRRLREEDADVKTRKELIKALGQSKGPEFQLVRRFLEQFLFDEELAADAADSLERLEEQRAGLFRKQ